MPGIIQLQELDAAYIAGLLDREGSFQVGKHRNKTKHCSRRGFNWELRIGIGMTDRGGLDFLAEKFNKKRLRTSRAQTPRNKPSFHLTLFAGELRQCLHQIIPHLKVRRKQAELLWEAISIIGPKKNEKVDTRLEEIYLEMRALNKKGPKRGLPLKA